MDGIALTPSAMRPGDARGRCARKEGDSMKAAVCLLTLVAAAAGPAWGQAAVPEKIGVFDAQRVSEETAEGKRIQDRLTKFSEKKRADLAAKEREAQDLQEKLNAQALSLSPEKRSGMEKDLQKKVLELNQAREAAQREMQLEVAEAENGFREKLVAAVESFGRDEAFAVVLDRNAVAYFHPSRDVTTAIVDRFNKMFPVPQDAPAAKDEGKGTAPPASPPTTPEKKK